MSACPSVYINALTLVGFKKTKFDTRDLYANLLRNFEFGQNRTKISGTWHEDRRTFYICRRREFSTQALLCTTEYLYIVDSDMHLNNRHRTYCCVSTAKIVKRTNHNVKLLHILSISCILTLNLRCSRTGTVWFYTSTNNKRAARPKLYRKSLTRDLKRMYSRLTLVRISINLWDPCVLYIGTGVSLLFRESFLYI